MDFAREFSLPVNTIERDYVLGWLLAGIANDAELFEKWIFKGGTCLKKCYFETYRFSEDLDYTLTDANHIDEKFLADRFKKISKWILESEWSNMLSHQVPMLPPKEQFWQELPNRFAWLHGGSSKPGN